MTLDDCRQFYAQEIRLAAGLRSPGLIDAFARVPREKFLGPGPWSIVEFKWRSKPGPPSYCTTEDPRDLYHNVLVAIDPARKLNNGQPSALASWIESLGVKSGDRVFHLGCGVGYYTAIMAELAGPGGSVVAIEVLPELAERARENLSGYPHVKVHVSDGGGFDPGRCDAIFINAGVTHPHPPWLDQLTDHGRLVLPLTIASGHGFIIKITREPGGFAAGVVSGVHIYASTKGRDSDLEPVIGQALKAGTLLKLRSVRRDPHELSDTCIIHGRETCLSSMDLP